MVQIGTFFEICIWNGRDTLAALLIFRDKITGEVDVWFGGLGFVTWFSRAFGVLLMCLEKDELTDVPDVFVALLVGCHGVRWITV